MKNKMVKIIFQLDENIHQAGTESIWASKVGENLYRVENVPFYAKGVSFADCVSVTVESKELIFLKVVEKSGHSTYRIYLYSPSQLAQFEEFWKPLQEAGCTYEKATSNLFAIDIPPATDISRVFDLLTNGESAGIWDFEEGDCAHVLSK